MSKFLTKGRLAWLVIIAVLVVDQAIKFAVKLNMYWHEHIRITDWFYIYFTENNGMAFGLEVVGKVFLTSFRIVAVAVIGWFLYKFVKHGMKTGFIVCVSLILAGALGNIVDSMFYGLIFNESTYSQVATFLPAGDSEIARLWPGGGYVLFPHHRDYVADVDALGRWRRVRVLQPHL